MNKQLLLIAGNYYPEATGIGRYNTEMIDWLADHGFECTVISTYPYYPYWKIQKPYEKKNRWFITETKMTLNNNKIKVYRCPHFVPANPTGKNRILFDFSFFISVVLKLAVFVGKKYNYVINVTPPLPLGIIAAFYKRITGALFLYHIQDLQVDAARDLNMITSKKLINGLLKTEKFILKNSDRISTISSGMQKKVEEKTDKKVFLFPNWTDTKNFYPLQNKAALKQSFGFNADVPVVLYSGAIGEKQGLENMLFAAQHFQQDKVATQFIICGSGPYRAVLEKKAAELELDNISFMPLQPNEKLNAFLNMTDVHLVIQKAGAADLVMPSKLTNILSVGGLAVVTADEGSGLYDTIKENAIGLLCNAEDVTALKICIERGITKENNKIRLNARQYAEEYLSIDKIMQHYVTEVMNN